MIFNECAGKATEAKIIEKKCPICGAIIEFMPNDTEVVCDKCKQTITREKALEL